MIPSTIVESSAASLVRRYRKAASTVAGEQRFNASRSWASSALEISGDAVGSFCDAGGMQVGSNERIIPMTMQIPASFPALTTNPYSP